MYIRKQTYFHRQIYHFGLFIALTVALALALAACSSQVKLSSTDCPSEAILADTETFVAFHNNNMPLWQAQLGGITLDCKLDRENGQVTSQLLFGGTVTFQADMADIDAGQGNGKTLTLPVFVLLLDPDDEIRARRDIVIEVRRAASGVVDFVYEIENINFVPAENTPPAAYRVLIGFQLDRAQLTFNRKARRQRLRL